MNSRHVAQERGKHHGRNSARADANVEDESNRRSDVPDHPNTERVLPVLPFAPDRSPKLALPEGMM
jgi:hypothetical protein